MILVEMEPALPAVVESAKAQVLACLGTMHKVREFSGRRELVAFLDEVLDGLQQAGAPRGLTRVLLFARTPGLADDVAKRMVDGGVLRTWVAPGCWMELRVKVPDMRAWAARMDPNFARVPGGI